MKLPVFFIFILIPLLFQMGYSQTITLEAFLDLVVQRHPFFAQEALQAEIEEKNRERFLGAQDWVISASPVLLHRKLVTSNAFAPRRINQFSVDAIAERVYWKTGGRLAFSWSSQFLNQSISDIALPGVGSIPVGPSTFYRHGIFATYSHPLMQNRGGKLDRLEYDLAEYNINFAKLQALENQEDFLLDLGNRYLDWAFISEQIKIARERLRLADDQLEQTTKMRNANLVDQVDVLRTEDAVRIAKQNIVLLNARWKAVQAELGVQAQSQEIYHQNPEFDLYKMEVLPSPGEVISRLRERSRLLQVLAVRREQLAYQREGFVEISRPQLFLNLSTGLQEGDEGFGNALILDKPDLAVSLNFSFPLGNRTAKADLEKTDLQIQQIEKGVKNVELELEAAARNLLIHIKELEKVLALNQEQIESAKKKTAEELKLYNQGRGQLTFVIQSRDNEENAKLTYAGNALTYHKLIIEYRALMDQLYTGPVY